MILCQAERASVSSPLPNGSETPWSFFVSRTRNLTVSNRPGPHTQAGKAASSRNATKYGLTSLHPVVATNPPGNDSTLFDTHTPNRINTLRNESLAPAPPAHSTLLDTSHPTKSTLCETKSPHARRGPPPQPTSPSTLFDTPNTQRNHPPRPRADLRLLDRDFSPVVSMRSSGATALRICYHAGW